MYVIYDLEFTTWEGAAARDWTGEGESREIVQIGALRVNPETLSVKEEFDALVRPLHNMPLSRYFERLTGITNAAVEERGINFLNAYRDFLKFCDGGYALSYGNDMIVLGENMVRQIPPMQSPHVSLPAFVNIRSYINETLPRTSGVAGGQLRTVLGIDEIAPPGQAHNALFDCYSVLDALRYLRAQGYPLFSLT